MSDSDNTFRDTLTASMARWKVFLDPEKLAQFRAHFVAMVETNRTLNLTRMTDPTEAAVKHYADSLAMLLWSEAHAPNTRTVLDIGTGAGFPAIPLAVMRPHWDITAIDSTAKKIRFVTDTARQLGLQNLKAEHAHTDHWQPASRFDLVTMRAVSSLSECVSIGSRFASSGGSVIAYKTATLEAAEVNSAHATARAIGLSVADPFQYDLQLGDERIERALYVYHTRR